MTNPKGRIIGFVASPRYEQLDLRVRHSAPAINIKSAGEGGHEKMPSLTRGLEKRGARQATT